MATIDSVKLPDNSTYDLTDNYSGYQTETLATPITVDGTSETTVEGALGGLNDYGNALADNLAANEENGAKNFNVYPYYDTTKAENGITFTDNGDGTITVTGTASANTVFYCEEWTKRLPLGTFILSGCPNVSGCKFYFRTQTSGGTFPISYFGSADYTFTNNANDIYELSIYIENGTALPVGGVTFYPMIRDARIVDGTFVPFAMTNKQLTDTAKTLDKIKYYESSGASITVPLKVGMLMFVSRASDAVKGIFMVDVTGNINELITASFCTATISGDTITIANTAGVAFNVTVIYSL